jgi:hypothetical protein
MDLERTFTVRARPGGLVTLTRVVEKAPGGRHENPSLAVRLGEAFERPSGSSEWDGTIA